MQSGIYRIRNTVNGKVYIGSAKNFIKRWKRHQTSLDKNKHCNIRLQRSYNIHGKTSFVYEIIELVEYEKNKIIERENYYIQLYDSKNTGYNIADGSFGDVLTAHPDRTRIIEQMVESSKRRAELLTDDERQNELQNRINNSTGDKNGMFGKTHTTGARNKISKARSEYVIINGCGPNKGKKLSVDHKKKISDNAKLRIGDKNPFFGKTHSEETKNMIRSKTIGKKPSNRKKLLADGIEYESAADCARANNISAGLVTYRIKSQKYNYEYIV